jgi:pimeloyl-ACP methyl ester carboxylesterase
MRRALLLFALAALAATLFVAASLTGRGTRTALGTPSEAAGPAGRVVYYDGEGAGAVVVLLASWARPASDFNELADALSRGGLRTLAVESRGIGGSQGGGPGSETTLRDLADDVRAVLAAAAVPRDQPVHVLGHAFGNRVARRFAAAFPERTRSVVLVAAGGGGPLPAPLTRALFVSSLSFLPWSLREPELRRAFFAPQSDIPAHWRTGWCLWGGLAQDSAVRSARPEDFWSAGGRVPMLVIQAEQDVIAPAEQAGLRLKAEFPERVSLVRVPAAGHALLPEQPERIERAVLAFLR